MTTSSQNVPCYKCGYQQPRTESACGRCGASFRRFCHCGTEVGMYDGRCANCGRQILHRSLRRGWAWYRSVPWKKVGRGISVAGVLAVGAFFALRLRGGGEDETWLIRDRALIALQSGDFTGAATGFQAITERLPRDAQAWFMLGSSHRAAKLPRDVWMPSVQKAAEIDPGLGPANGLLALGFIEGGDPDRALPLARTAVRLQPDDPVAWRVLGSALLLESTPSPGEAERALTRARELGDVSLPTLVSLAEVRLRLSGWLPANSQPPDLADAIREATTALERSDAREFGGQGAVGLARAQMAAARGDARAAHEVATSAMGRIEPGEDARNLRAELLLVRARAQAQIGDAVGAGADVLGALQVRPEYDVADRAAAMLSGAGRADDVLGILARAAEQRDPQRQIRTVLAELHAARGDADAAQKAIGEDPAGTVPDLRARLVRGDIEAAAGRPGEAARIYKECIAAEPARTEPAVRLAALALRGDPDPLARASRISEAAGLLEAARARVGEDPSLTVALGRLHMAAGASTRAREEFRKATVAVPGVALAWRLYGAACLRDGADAVAAAEAFRRAKLLDPRDSDVVALEAEALLLSGDPGAAAAACSAFLRDHPTDRTTLRLRARANRMMGLWSAAAADLRALYSSGDRDEETILSFVEAEYASRRVVAAREIVADVLPGASPRLAALLSAAASLHEAESVDQASERLKGADGRAIAATLFLLAGRRDDSLVAARESVRLAPGAPLGVRALVLALCDGGDATALAEAREAVRGLADPVPEGLRDFLSGRIEMSERRFAEARVSLERAAVSLGEDPFLAMCLGVAKIEAGDAEGGLATLRASVVMPGALPGARRVIAPYVLRATASSPDRRRRELGAFEALSLDPSSVEASLAAADALAHRGQHRTAAETLERTMSLGTQVRSADMDRLRWSAAASRLAAGDTPGALAHLAALPAEAQNGSAGRLLRGFAHLGESRFGDAEREFEAVRAQEPTNELAITGSAVSRVRRRDVAGALEIVTAWIEGKGNPRVGVYLGRMLAAAGQLEGAVDLARRIRIAAPGEREGLDLLCESLARRGRRDEAVAEARKAGSGVGGLAPSAARLALGAVLRAVAADYEGALGIARSVRQDPAARPEDVAEARVLEAESLAALGRSDEARSVLEALVAGWSEGVAVSPTDRAMERRVRFVRGLLSAGRGRFHEAAPDFRRCYETDPADAPALNNLAWCLAQPGGDPAEALELSGRLTALEPKNPGWWDTRATAAAAARDAAEATRAWTTALELYRAGPASGRAAHAAAALRFARFLRDGGRSSDAADAAREALGLAPDGPLAAEARLIAEGNPR